MSRPRLVDALSLPAYDFGPGHPFARDRQQPLFDLIACHGLVEPGELLAPRAATRDELLLAHDADYVDFVERLSAEPTDAALVRAAPRFGLGTADNPIAGGLHAAAAAAAGSAVAGIDAIVSGDADRVFHPAGGLHHAMPRAASGFCVYNDLVVAIRHARARGFARVAYVDFDVHHGDGVELAFRDDPSVLTVSFHEDPAVRWPFTGRVEDVGSGAARGTIVNLPFASGTTDASWQEVVGCVLRESLARFRPELLVTQHGADTHRDDPLADLELTTASCDFAARLGDELAREHCGGRWLATGGGGYQPLTVLPRAWTIVWARLAGRTLPERVDDGWRARWGERARVALPERFLDPPHAGFRAAAAASANRRTLAVWRSRAALHSGG